MIGYAVQKEGITGIPEVYVYDSQNRYLFMEVAILVGYSSTTVTIRGAGYNQWDDKDKIYILNEKGHKISEHYSPLPKQEQPRYSPPPRPLTPEEIEAQRRENEEFFRFLGQLFIFPFKLIEWLFKPITKWCDKHGLNQEVFTIGGSNTTKNNTNNEKANNTNVNMNSSEQSGNTNELETNSEITNTNFQAYHNNNANLSGKNNGFSEYQETNQNSEKLVENSQVQTEQSQTVQQTISKEPLPFMLAINRLWSGSFNGRCSLREYWITLAAYFFICFLPVVVIDLATMGLANILLFLLFLKPILAINCRRLHDCNMSGWIQVPLIPFVVILMIICGLIPGSEEENKYGQPSKY